MRSLLPYSFGYFTILLIGFLTLLLPWWLKESILIALKSQDWVSIDIFRLESRTLKKISVGCVILAGLVSWACTGGFIGAITALFFLPWVLIGCAWIRKNHVRRQLETDFIGNLYTLKGLVDVGTPLPQALYLISKESSTKLNFFFTRIIKGFQSGKSFEAYFTTLERKSPSAWALRSLRLLEKAYRKGLALSPLLESLIQLIELESQLDDRLKRLQRDLGLQAFLASLIPWLVGLVCWIFQEEMIQDSFKSFEGKLIILSILLWEGFGLWFLRQAVRFY